MYGAHLRQSTRLLPGLTLHSDGLSSLDALLEALSHLDDVCSSIEERYHASLAGGQYERWQEKS